MPKGVEFSGEKKGNLQKLFSIGFIFTPHSGFIIIHVKVEQAINLHSTPSFFSPSTDEGEYLPFFFPFLIISLPNERRRSSIRRFSYAWIRMPEGSGIDPKFFRYLKGDASTGGLTRQRQTRGRRCLNAKKAQKNGRSIRPFDALMGLERLRVDPLRAFHPTAR